MEDYSRCTTCRVLTTTTAVVAAAATADAAANQGRCWSRISVDDEIALVDCFSSGQRKEEKDIIHCGKNQIMYTYTCSA